MSDDDDNHPLGSGLSSLIRLSGVNVPARARFVGEAIVSATMYSITLGLCCGSLGAVVTPMGPLVPFLFGSAMGYSYGLLYYWADVRRRTLWYAQRYPTVLAHALLTERFIIVPASIIKNTQELLRNSHNREEQGEPHQYAAATFNMATLTLESWILEGGLGRLTWSVLAAQTCREDIEAIQRQERQQLIEKLANSKDGDDDDDNT